MRLDAESLRDIDRCLALEWLETNGIGGYACGTVLGANTRRYHGLLIAATEPPVRRVLLLSKLEEALVIGDEAHELSTNIYADVMHPLGFRYLAEFEKADWPRWVYQIGPWRLVKEVFMVHGRNATVVRYRLEEGDHPVWLLVRPLLAFRDHHGLQHARNDLNTAIQHADGAIAMQPFGPESRVALSYGRGEFLPDGLWYYRFRYPVEQERGLDYMEDLYSPGQFKWLMAPGDTVWVVAEHPGGEPWTLEDIERAAEQEAARRRELARQAGDSSTLQRLAASADQFVVRRRAADGSEKISIIAGYPWFADWGRDAFISAPGILIATGRLDEARELFELYISHMRGGLVPNCFSEADGQPAYNSADAVWWMFAAARLYLQASGDDKFMADVLYPALCEAVDAHMQGTEFEIHADPADGLLWVGSPETQLTWMDAKVNGVPVTPRWGKPVEIQALWFNALRLGEYCARKLGDEARHKWFRAAAAKVRRNFLRLFWLDERGYFCDCINEQGRDESLRPNQVIALSLPYKLVSDALARRALEAVERKLLTPYGLRTLSPDDPRFCPHYQGGPAERDAAYHQGTVWPWLLGPFVRARAAVEGRSEKLRQWAKQLLAPLLDHFFNQGCLGHVAEIFDAMPPHLPRGCFAQAWSLAELLRAWRELGLDA